MAALTPSATDDTVLLQANTLRNSALSLAKAVRVQSAAIADKIAKGNAGVTVEQLKGQFDKTSPHDWEELQRISTILNEAAAKLGDDYK